jgi:CheY-like chemotaxis protein
MERVSGRVLVVDDDPEMRALLKRRLNRLGAAVDEADNFLDATHLLDGQPYDLVLCDFNIIDRTRPRGHHHGGRILEHARRVQPNLPFYFVSGLFSMITPEMQRTYLELANGFVEKPVSREKIAEIVTLHLKAADAREDVP